MKNITAKTLVAFTLMSLPIHAVHANLRCLDVVQNLETKSLNLGTFNIHYQSTGFVKVIDLKGQELSRIDVPKNFDRTEFKISDLVRLSTDVFSLRFETKNTIPGMGQDVQYQLFRVTPEGKITALTKFENGPRGEAKSIRSLTDGTFLVEFATHQAVQKNGEYRSVRSYQLMSLNNNSEVKVIRTWEDSDRLSVGQNSVLFKHNDVTSTTELLRLNLATGKTESLLKVGKKTHPLRPALDPKKIHLSQITPSLIAAHQDLGSSNQTFHDIELYRISEKGPALKLADIGYNTRKSGIEVRPHRTVKALDQNTILVIDDFSYIVGDIILQPHQRVIMRDFQITVVRTGDKAAQKQELLHTSQVNMGEKNASGLDVVVRSENEFTLQGRDSKDVVVYKRSSKGTFLKN